MKKIKVKDLINKGYKGVNGDMLITNVTYMQKKVSRIKNLLASVSQDIKCSGCDMSPQRRLVNKARFEVENIDRFLRSTRDRRQIIGDITEE